MAELHYRQDASNKTEDAGDDRDCERPVEAALMRSKHAESDNHEDHSQEAHDAEGEDGGVLGDAVDAQVDGSQDHSQEQGDEADGDHSLHSLEPVVTDILLTTVASLPQALVVVGVDGPGGGGKAYYVQDGGEDQAHKDGTSHTPERDGMHSYPGRGAGGGYRRRLSSRHLDDF